MNKNQRVNTSTAAYIHSRTLTHRSSSLLRNRQRCRESEWVSETEQACTAHTQTVPIPMPTFAYQYLHLHKNDWTRANTFLLNRMFSSMYIVAHTSTHNRAPSQPLATQMYISAPMRRKKNTKQTFTGYCERQLDCVLFWAFFTRWVAVVVVVVFHNTLVVPPQ